jgi:hypothetical protein
MANKKDDALQPDNTQETSPANTQETTVSTPQEVEGDKSPKMVKIKLFKDKGEYKDDVFVAVNGIRYQIQRGVEVEVPDFVKEVLDNSDRQDRLTAELIERETEKADGVPK